MKSPERLPSSFRDPSGIVFERDGTIYRQVNRLYQSDYRHLMDSGLYQTLTEQGQLLPHQEISDAEGLSDEALLVIRPERIPFISYPYEWSFSQLQDAALLTLALQERALRHEMILKDASAYNIQFRSGKPVLIDTLSFERYREGEPWVAYGQFCRHFLAPLALMHYVDIQLGHLLRVHLDGIPLPLASRLLPWRCRLRFGLLIHIHLHARAQLRHANSAATPTPKTKRLGKQAMLALIQSLQAAIRRMHWRPRGTEWAGYYQQTNYSDSAMTHKQEIVRSMLARTSDGPVWDLGANTGRYSRLATEIGREVVAFDVDPAAVEQHYLQARATAESSPLPLLQDLTNPSPALGWRNRERDRIEGRGRPQTVMALALIHHLAIANNTPLAEIAACFAEMAPELIIEFVPKSDSQVQRLLATRRDIFSTYNQQHFEEVFKGFYSIVAKEAVHESERTIYLMQRHAETG